MNWLLQLLLLLLGVLPGLQGKYSDTIFIASVAPLQPHVTGLTTTQIHISQLLSLKVCTGELFVAMLVAVVMAVNTLLLSLASEEARQQ
jgi:hypothetical protein